MIAYKKLQVEASEGPILAKVYICLLTFNIVSSEIPINIIEARREGIAAMPQLREQSERAGRSVRNVHIG